MNVGNGKGCKRPLFLLTVSTVKGLGNYVLSASGQSLGVTSDAVGNRHLYIGHRNNITGYKITVWRFVGIFESSKSC